MLRKVTFEEIVDPTVARKRRRRRGKTRTDNLESGSTRSNCAIVEPTLQNSLQKNAGLGRSAIAVTT